MKREGFERKREWERERGVRSEREGTKLERERNHIKLERV